MKAKQVKKLSHSLPELLPVGAQKTIAESLNMNRQSVMKILRGEWSNERVIETAIDIINEQQNKMTTILAEYQQRTGQTPS